MPRMRAALVTHGYARTNRSVSLDADRLAVLELHRCHLGYGLMAELKQQHTLHAEHMVTMFNASTYKLVCACGEVKAIVTVSFREGFLHITAVDDCVTVAIGRDGSTSTYAV